ncbi:unnamed protein product [Urochloa decumbens]|uniref:NAD-dependent epimerase/dehydratase domain-containing protein n=1 Tax=Urochloa decumbens TaxID=240449 RepID=A0ABC9BUE6_9POAL
MGADKADICAASGHGRTVCVTGAGGFIASWLVKLLLEKGYTVRGTVRNPMMTPRTRTSERWTERLTLVRADLLDKESLTAALRGCEGVFHTASPVTDDPKMIEPAVNGTKNVINAAADVSTVRRVVFTSSIGTVYMDPRHAPGAEVDETCWSDLNYCKNTKGTRCRNPKHYVPPQQPPLHHCRQSPGPRRSYAEVVRDSPDKQGMSNEMAAGATGGGASHSSFPRGGGQGALVGRGQGFNPGSQLGFAPGYDGGRGGYRGWGRLQRGGREHRGGRRGRGRRNNYGYDDYGYGYNSGAGYHEFYGEGNGFHAYNSGEGYHGFHGGGNGFRSYDPTHHGRGSSRGGYGGRDLHHGGRGSGHHKGEMEQQKKDKMEVDDPAHQPPVGADEQVAAEKIVDKEIGLKGKEVQRKGESSAQGAARNGESKAATVKIIEGSMTASNIAVELERLVPELTRMVLWGALQAKSVQAKMEVHEIKETEIYKEEVPIVWAVGSILGVTKMVDMRFTKLHGVARVENEDMANNPKDSINNLGNGSNGGIPPSGSSENSSAKNKKIKGAATATNWYCYAKTVAEQAAWELAKQRQLDLVVVNPSLELGPLLQPSVNASTLHILKYLDGSVKTYTDAVQAYVHMQDVADAHARVYEEPGAWGQYLCAGRTLHRGEVCRMLAKMFPEYPVPTECKGGAAETKKGCLFSSRRLAVLSVGVTPATLCLYDTVTSLQEGTASTLSHRCCS